MANNTSEDIKLPKLDASGKEWTTWKVRLQVVIANQGLSGYLDGTMTKPIDPATGQSPGWMATTPDKVKEVTEYVKNLAVWVEKDTKVCHIITNTLPNSLFIRIANKKSTHEYFNTLSTLFEQRSVMVGAELQWQLGKLKLKEGGDARAHIDKIIILREELASIGRPVSDDDLFNIIYASLPCSYNPRLASLSATMRLQKKAITLDELMDIVTKEYDQITLQDGRKLKEKAAASEDAAFGADTSKNRKGQWKKFKFTGTCHNCGWMGHKGGDCWEEGGDCWKEGGGKAGQAPKGWKLHGKKPKDSKDPKNPKGSTLAHTADQPDCVWLALIDPPTEVNSYLARTDTTSVPKLYDSGASQHLSPSRK